MTNYPTLNESGKGIYVPIFILNEKKREIRSLLPEKRSGIFAVAVKLGEFFHDSGAVCAIGHAEPAAVGIEDFHCHLAALNQRFDARRNRELGFRFADMLFKKFHETLAA